MSFGLVFPDRTCVISRNELSVLDENHWYINLEDYLGPTHLSTRYICVFQMGPTSIPLGKDLVVYLAHSGEVFCCGAIQRARSQARLMASTRKVRSFQRR